MFKSIVISVIVSGMVLTANQVDSAPASRGSQSAEQMLQRFLQTLITKDQDQPNRGQDFISFETKPTERDSNSRNSYFNQQTPPTAPAAHQHSNQHSTSSAAAPASVDTPVAWPFPPAPKSSHSNSEFPLLDRFLSGNRNHQNTPIYSSAQSSSSQPSSPQYSSPQYSSPQYSSPQYSGAQYSSPQHSNPVYKESTPTSAQYNIPPPLSLNDNHHVHHGPGPSQPRHFSLDTIRLSDKEQPNGDKLNVSFIMPPNIRPLNLNFDSGDIVVDFGENSGKSERISSENYNSRIPDLDQIYRSPSNPNKESKPEKDEDYIIVRHDSNKYAYDMSRDGSASAGNADADQGAQVERYQVPANKDRHFVLGRI